VAAFPQHASSPQQLIACADTAMYEAKAANKNCVRVSTGPLQNPKVEKPEAPDFQPDIQIDKPEEPLTASRQQNSG
jgi:hypothetical protein